jgi:hypothetical protein
MLVALVALRARMRMEHNFSSGIYPLKNYEEGAKEELYSYVRRSTLRM